MDPSLYLIDGDGESGEGMSDSIREWSASRMCVLNMSSMDGKYDVSASSVNLEKKLFVLKT